MRPFFDTYTFTIAANGIYDLPYFGRWLAVLSNSLTTAPKITLGGGLARGSLPAGVAIELPEGEKFRQAHFENPTGSAMVLIVALSVGRILDSRVVFGDVLPITDAGNTIETPLPLAVTAAPGLAVEIAADAHQLKIIITNTGTQEVWVGDASVEAPSKIGIPVAVDGVLILRTTSAVYLQSVAAGAGQVSYMRIRRV